MQRNRLQTLITSSIQQGFLFKISVSLRKKYSVQGLPDSKKTAREKKTGKIKIERIIHFIPKKFIVMTWLYFSGIDINMQKAVVPSFFKINMPVLNHEHTVNSSEYE